MLLLKSIISIGTCSIDLKIIFTQKFGENICDYFTIISNWNQRISSSIDEWLNKLDCPYNRILFSNKKPLNHRKS
jgi:hypothetical protein